MDSWSPKLKGTGKTAGLAAAFLGGPGGVAERDVDFLALALAHGVHFGAQAAGFEVRLDAVAQIGQGLLEVHAESMEDVVNSRADSVHFLHSAVPSIR